MTNVRRGSSALAVAVVSAWAASTPPAAPARPALRSEVIGRSVQGRPLRLVRVGDPGAPRRVLVVGCIHGNECAGVPVLQALRAASPPAGAQLLLLDTANPDGRAAGTRGNARGVDLNRNFPWGWKRLRGIFDSGPRPSSEPETRALQALVLRERPAVSVWYHQALRHVDLQPGSDEALMRRYAGRVGLPAVRTALLPGTVARWTNRRLPAASAFVVELAAGRLSPAQVRAHVRAVMGAADADDGA